MNVLFSLLLLLATLAVSQVRSHTHTSTHRLHSQPRIFVPHLRALATQALLSSDALALFQNTSCAAALAPSETSDEEEEDILFLQP